MRIRRCSREPMVLYYKQAEQMPACPLSDQGRGMGVNFMTSIGWEFYGLKFSVFMTMMVAVATYLYVALSTPKGGQLAHVDGMAGDEGDE